MSDKRMALDLIEASLEGYRALLTDPPKYVDELSQRKGAADRQQAGAGELMRCLAGRDRRTVVIAFSAANAEMEHMDARISVVSSEAEEPQDS